MRPLSGERTADLVKAKCIRSASGRRICRLPVRIVPLILIAECLSWHDASAIWPEVLYRLLCGDDRAKDVNVELAVKLILRDLFQQQEPVHAA